MKKYDSDHVRSIALVGHSGSGKTSLSEAMLFDAGGLTRMGRVEDGNTVSDYDSEERRRGISISMAIVPVEWKDYKVNVLDAPGYMDFVGDVYSACSAADAAVVVVDAVSGVEVGTELAWQVTDEVSVPHIIFVNKMDRENADYQRVLQNLREVFGANFVPVQIPIGSETSFSGVVDLISRKSYLGEDGTEGDVPADLADEVAEAHTNLMEAAAEGDDDLIMKYLEGEDLEPSEIMQGLEAGIRSGDIVPVCFGSATHNIGIQGFLQSLTTLVPTFTGGDGVAVKDSGGEESLLAPDPSRSPILFAFKTVADPYVGKVTYFKVVGGKLDSEFSRLFNTRTESEERLGQFYVVQGKELINIDGASLGDIAAVAKLSETITGDTLAVRDEEIFVVGPEYPSPLYEVAIHPVTQQDSAKMGPALTRLREQDPTLRWRYETGTRQTILSGMGDTHIDVAVRNLEEKFGVSVITSVPKVPYHETVTRSAQDSYRHKKQTGGAGQFAEVHMEVKPLDRGVGFEYDTKRVFGGSISNSFFPSIEKGIRSVLENGVIAGYPVVDVRCEVYDGKMHPVDSKDIAFQIAGREVFRGAFSEAGPVLLEPIVDVAVTVPDEYVGDIIGDLNTRRALVQGMGQERGKSVIQAQVPLAEMQRYATELRSLTQGRGVYTLETSHYAIVPNNIAQEIIEETRKEKEEGK
ncbi:MAG: elongation factor G [Chloroflexota bacterium]|nr:elongation factor G [Chloroflexota bacterium]